MARTTRTELRLRREAEARRSWNRRKLVAGVTAGMMLLGSAALADYVENDILEADSNTVELDVGDTREVTITYIVETTPVDGAGCNIGGSSNQAVIDVVSADPSKVSVTPSTLTFNDCTEDDLPATRTVTVEGLAPTGGVGVNIVFALDEDETSMRSGTRRILTADADFVVNVLAPETDGPTRAAPAIANEFLRDRSDNDDCMEAQGTNKTKNNWHGKLISQVSQHFEGRTFSSAQANEVTTYVAGLCSAN